MRVGTTSREARPEPAKISRRCRIALAGVWMLVSLLAVDHVCGDPVSHRARVKDVATIEGIRDNQLVGYGLIVGLRGTGDSSQTVFPAQTLISTLLRMGITVPQTGSNSASNMQ